MSGSEKIRFSSTSRKEQFSALSIPRWIAILLVVSIALILWIGVLTDSSGSRATPDTVLYVAGVILIVAFLARADRKRSGVGRRHKKEVTQRDPDSK
jgi:hypothetical protein